MIYVIKDGGQIRLHIDGHTPPDGTALARHFEAMGGFLNDKIWYFPEASEALLRSAVEVVFAWPTDLLTDKAAKEEAYRLRAKLLERLSLFDRIIGDVSREERMEARIEQAEVEYRRNVLKED